MAVARPTQTVTDYVTLALSPALIVGLVSSLVFFLLEVFYDTDGPWKGRLQWILFFYVFGIVLTARISMRGDVANRSKVYGSLLALGTYLGMQAYVEMPEAVRPVSFAVNLFLILLVWWCVHRLVWDCTNVDENADMNAAGLLLVAGLEGPAAPDPGDIPEIKEPPASRARLTGFDLWWQRYRSFREKQTRKRTLGVWVVYFSLAALPLFGLGQALIPLSAPDRRAFAFWLLTGYVGCALGLLLTTCFLGLRRYLRQKNLEMPASMARAWLSFGAVLILAILLVAALLPRPYAEYSVLDVVDRAGSAKRRANQVAMQGDSPGEGEGQRGPGDPDVKGEGDRTGDKGRDPSNADKDGRGGKGSKDGKNGKSSSDGKDGKGRSDAGDRGSKATSDGKAPDDARKKAEAARKAAGETRTNEGKKGGQQAGKGASSSQRTNALGQFFQKVGPWLKWLVFAGLGVVVVVALLRGGLGFLANFTDWARQLLEAWRNFWARLFGAKEEAVEGGGLGQMEEAEPERGAPFSAFANPFDSGKASRMDPRQLVRYTFAALEAWARERDLGRRPDETAQEFIARLGDELPTLEKEASRMGELHGRVEYGQGGLPGGAVETVRQFWDRLERVTEAPLSA